jgi:hypothetical protein
MDLSRFFELAVSAGARVDPRGDSGQARSYDDSAILYGDAGRDIRSVLVGIDIDAQEILLADRLKRSQRIDCVVSHHPSGKAYAGLFKVMELQVDLLEKAGLDRRSAEEFLRERKAEVERRILPQNHMRAVDAARLLDIPFVCLHTPADNLAAWYVNRLFAKNGPEKVQDVVDLLCAVPEYSQAAQENTGPRIILGHPGRPAGKIFVEMTGGAEGPKDSYPLLQEAGIATLVSMHIGEEHLKKVQASSLNAVIAGHISSDTLGMNLLLDSVEKEEGLRITCCSGFRRTRRP